MITEGSDSAFTRFVTSLFCFMNMSDKYLQFVVYVQKRRHGCCGQGERTGRSSTNDDHITRYMFNLSFVMSAR